MSMSDFWLVFCLGTGIWALCLPAWEERYPWHAMVPLRWFSAMIVAFMLWLMLEG